ncbi:hypothetical protein A0H81_03205 [Grifola frondosa]|uniref:Uncharacterized protein n=1 Tax=Grifola frondosa TaxID=5627 RepID=A0A1C7MK25_GRIFR|nr:hypothetical protein A0H81_03205 [Grifola frondosa]
MSFQPPPDDVDRCVTAFGRGWGSFIATAFHHDSVFLRFSTNLTGERTMMTAASDPQVPHNNCNYQLSSSTIECLRQW